MANVSISEVKRSADLVADNLSKLQNICLAIGFCTLAGALLMSWQSDEGYERLSHAYLLSFCFYLSISLGALFFVILQHLSRARWSVVLRRQAEVLASVIPTLGIMFLVLVVPMLFGDASLYRWNDEAVRETDILVQGKAPYLNAPFFAVRFVGYFLCWILMARFFMRYSLIQDSASDAQPTALMQKWSGPSMLAFSLTVNFAAFDWLMSLDPHWFSTIFGIYFFAGCAVAVFATMAIMSTLLQKQGFIKRAITTEHYHDIGKFLFGFMFFWAYIAFSQFLLIWYANIPEETVWFKHRQEHGWQYISLVLIFGHFVIPFLGLMSRHVRRNRKALIFWSFYLLLMHWFDLYWLIIPSTSPHAVSIGLYELLTFVGVGAIWLAAVARRMEGTRLVPTGDPHLADSLAFHNV